MAKRGWFWVVFGALVAVLVWRESRPEPSASLLQWVNVVALISPPPGTGWDRIEMHPRLAEAIRGTDPDRLRETMREAGLEGIWVGVEPESPSGPELPLGARFAAGGVVRGFRGKRFTSEGLLYVLDETSWPVVLSDRALARVARGVLEGSKPPPLEAFPEAFTRPQPIEVLVLLAGGRGPRLWRSARAQSIAEALTTASLAARERWEERTETMGGPLGERLDQLDVEVAFLIDDGTFDRTAVSLIDTLVKPEHGVAYEQPARWRYMLPRATREAGSPTEAFRRLFRDNGLPEESFDRADLRLYRFRMQTISIDQGSTGSRRTSAPSESKD